MPVRGGQYALHTAYYAVLIVPKYPLLATELCVSTKSYDLLPLLHGGHYAVHTLHCSIVAFAPD